MSSLLAELPAFALLAPDAQAVVFESFEQVDFPFGAVIVREGDEADAFYVLAAGSARVVKAGEHGEEIALNTLHRGDSFGEAGLLDQTRRTATVRASSAVQVLRLHRSVFVALARAHPEVRQVFETLARERALWNFFRIHSSFATLPGEALAALVAGLEPVARARRRAGHPRRRAARSDVRRRGGAPARLSGRGRRACEISTTCARATSSASARSFSNEPRAASVEAVVDCSLLRLPAELLRRLARRACRVPRTARGADQPVRLPTRSRAFRSTSPTRSCRPMRRSPSTSPTSAGPLRGADEAVELAPPTGVRSSPAGAAFRTSTSSTRRIAAPPASRSSAATSAARSRSPHIRELVHTSTDGTTLAGITARRRGARARLPARCARRRAGSTSCRCRRSSTGRATTGSCSTASTASTSASPTRRAAFAAVPREEFLEHWSGYASVIAYDERFEDAPESRPSLAWLKPFLRPHLRPVAGRGRPRDPRRRASARRCRS